jgi:bifunctional non-homologous end joining protein LigD
LPNWIKPQLTQIVDEAAQGRDWLHEIKFDGYRMHARLDPGAARLLTLTGIDWTHKYPAIAAAVGSIGARQAYLNGELCGVGPTASPLSARSSWHPTAAMPLHSSSSCWILCTSMSKIRLDCRLSSARSDSPNCSRTPAHRCTTAIIKSGTDGSFTRRPATWPSKHRLETRRCRLRARQSCLWVKVKCLHREGFVVVVWTDPEGSRPYLGGLLFAYYDPKGRLVYAGRAWHRD